MDPATPAPIVYVTDLAFDRFDPADLFDLAFLLRSPDHELCAVCLTTVGGDGRRVLDALTLEASADLPTLSDRDGLPALLDAAVSPVNLIVVAGYGAVADALRARPDLFREKVARLFVVGGQANDYGEARNVRRLPIDPRLRQQLPQRFASKGDPRIVSGEERRAWATLLTSGQGIIWLPRDICLWRYAAPGVLGGGDAGPVAAFLLREAFYARLSDTPDRYRAAEQPVDLSALPALLLAARPDPAIWLRLFRAATARVEASEEGGVASIDLTSERPNLYIATAIDGQALGKLLTAALRVRPTGQT